MNRWKFTSNVIHHAIICLMSKIKTRDECHNILLHVFKVNNNGNRTKWVIWILMSFTFIRTQYGPEKLRMRTLFLQCLLLTLNTLTTTLIILIWCFFTKIQACNFIKKELRHRCFPVNIAKRTTLRATILKNTYERLFLGPRFNSYHLRKLREKWDYKTLDWSRF